MHLFRALGGLMKSKTLNSGQRLEQSDVESSFVRTVIGCQIRHWYFPERDACTLESDFIQ